MKDSGFLTNQFLLAMPSLEDINFSRSVTLICEHNEDGALGVVINRPTNLSVAEIFEQLDLEGKSIDCSDVVHFGGPVASERGLVLHESLGSWEYTLPITDTLGLTTSKDILDALSKGQGPKSYLFVLGYAGWKSGQLEAEIQENSWLIVPASREILFDTPIEQRWTKAAALAGIDIAKISSQVGHA